eukprot:gene12090-biopygen6420
MAAPLARSGVRANRARYSCVPGPTPVDLGARGVLDTHSARTPAASPSPAKQWTTEQVPGDPRCRHLPRPPVRPVPTQSAQPSCGGCAPVPEGARRCGGTRPPSVEVCCGAHSSRFSVTRPSRGRTHAAVPELEVQAHTERLTVANAYESHHARTVACAG